MRYPWGSRREARACLVALLLPACEDLPEVRYISDYVELAPYQDARVCAGTLDELDRVAAQLEERLELRFAERIRYYWGWQGAEEQCPSTDERGQVQGCAHPEESAVFGPLTSVRHEFAHVLGNRIGLTTRVLEEGFAFNATGICVSSTLQNGPSSLIPMTVAMYEDVGGDITGTAFVNYVIERFGRERFYQIKGRISTDADVATLDAAVRDVLGMTLDELEREWRDDASFQSCGVPWRWDDEEMLVYSFAPMTVTATLACDSLGTKGPIEPRLVIDDDRTFATDPVQPGMYVDRELTIPFTTRISMLLQGPPGAKAYLHGHDCWDQDDYDGHVGITTIELHEGEPVDEVFSGCTWRIFLVTEGYEPTAISLIMEPSNGA